MPKAYITAQNILIYLQGDCVCVCDYFQSLSTLWVQTFSNRLVYPSQKKSFTTQKSHNIKKHRASTFSYEMFFFFWFFKSYVYSV